DVIIFAVNPEGNEALDGGRLAVKISEVKPLPEPYPEDRTNNTVLAEDFGDQGYQGWYYGSCDWDGTSFKAVQNKDGDKYVGDDGLELKADYVHPGPDGGQSAAYKWVAAEDGTIYVTGEYTKAPNSAGANANGVTLRVVLNDEVKVWKGDNIQKGGITEPQTVTFDETFEVKKGDILIFAINPEGNNEYDGGKLSVKISDVKEEEPEPYPEDRTNNTVLAEDFGDQGSQGWFYGYTGWDGKGFKLLGDRDGEKYTGENGLELKADFVHPGPDGEHSAAYKWVVAEDGTIKVEGEYTKEPNSADANANGVTLRVLLNDAEKVWRGDNIAKGGITEPQTVTFDETFEVKKGDILIFSINPEGQNSYDGGRLSVKISDVKEEEPEPEPEIEYSVTYKYDGEYPEAVTATLPADDQKYKDGDEVTAKAPETTSVAADKDGDHGVWEFQGWDADTKTVQGSDVEFVGKWEFSRTNNANLKDDFSDKQGRNGWYYGKADWDGANFEELPYNTDKGGYKDGESKPELKADFVEPGGGKNAAYKWVAAKDGVIRVTGEYYKSAYDEEGTTGTCFRIRLNGGEKAFIGMNTANKSDERTESFDLTLDVTAGDVLLFLVDPEGNDAWDGGRVTASITPVE
ncbi:MAG: SHIRT domain-containing protein, partial [Erysipelotrichaceae bacterium]|nr:SHIRT domain-containing protein [Erysipelotrichaceae bacterium]